MEQDQLKKSLDDYNAKSTTAIAVMKICVLAMRKISEQEKLTEWDQVVFKQAERMFDAASKDDDYYKSKCNEIMETLEDL